MWDLYQRLGRGPTVEGDALARAIAEAKDPELRRRAIGILQVAARREAYDRAYLAARTIRDLRDALGLDEAHWALAQGESDFVIRHGGESEGERMQRLASVRLVEEQGAPAGAPAASAGAVGPPEEPAPTSAAAGSEAPPGPRFRLWPFGRKG
jgi:hypothetical protein